MKHHANLSFKSFPFEFQHVHSDIYLQIANNNSSNQINWISNICQRSTLLLADRKHVKLLNINVTRVEGCVLLIGGEPNGKTQLFNDPQVNSIAIPIYKNREKRIFEFGDRFDPPH